MQKIWVFCKHFGIKGIHAFGKKPLGYGECCPKCGSSWRQTDIIAATSQAYSSGILESPRLVDKSAVSVVWLEP